jgi:malate dehydrogenase (oxaloacetate-decarboxylating)(NADP+)
MEKEALHYHSKGRAGKIEVVPTKETATQKDLALAYSPGVAAPCLAIEADASKVYDYTTKGNLVAVISNGTAVLGLGDIGALASKPVMEGKAVLFKIFADIDVFDLELGTKNVEEFIRTVKILSPTFGGINLEDISAPDCFEIEERLKAELNIPIMHDDQHGTAIVSAAALLNALELTGRKIQDIKVVINGAGAAATSCASIYLALGMQRENLFMFDSKGLIHTDRDNLDGRKVLFTNQTLPASASLADALMGADMFLGLSKADILTEAMLQSMAKDCIVFALANPNPEISYEKAMLARPDIIFATGRSDFPNQVNNVLGFPYIFRGALDVRATKINEAMKLAAVHALAELTKLPVPQEVIDIYGGESIEFGPNAVAKAAIESGVAQIKELPI